MGDDRAKYVYKYALTLFGRLPMPTRRPLATGAKYLDDGVLYAASTTPTARAPVDLSNTAKGKAPLTPLPTWLDVGKRLLTLMPSALLPSATVFEGQENPRNGEICYHDRRNRGEVGSAAATTIPTPI
jgi:hypothetical protein